jgi:hypothetical protein
VIAFASSETGFWQFEAFRANPHVVLKTLPNGRRKALILRMTQRRLSVCSENTTLQNSSPWRFDVWAFPILFL